MTEQPSTKGARMRALDRYPLGLGMVPDDPDGASDWRQMYKLFVAFTHVQQDGPSRAYALTEAEADAWAADVAELLSEQRAANGTVWFTDSDGDRVSVPAAMVAFTNLSVDTGEDPDEPDEHPAAKDLAEFHQGMAAFLGHAPRSEG